MTSESTLRAGYDSLLLDLDGTLYLGSEAIPGASKAIEGGSQQLIYVTNNASRSPADVARHLSDLGFPADDEDVVTSSQAAARLLSERVEPGSAVLVVGAEALCDEVARVGLRPVRSAADDPRAVVQGHSPETAWPILAEASYAIRAGALWVAANTDTTLPTERGLAPGNGAMVAALRAATGIDPIVAGKPAAPLMEDALRRCGSRSALVVGDRLDTDIAGANEVGLDSLAVLTGVSSADDLLRAVPSMRPTYLAFTLDALNGPIDSDRCGWRAAIDGANIVLAGGGDALSALAVTAVVAWQNPTFERVVAEGADAEHAIRVWSDGTDRTSPRAVSFRAPGTEIG